jgi:hypothetical protein
MLIKNMNIIHTFSIIVGSLALIFGIIMSIIKGSFQDYFQLVFIGTILAGLGVMGRKNKKNPKV